MNTRKLQHQARRDRHWGSPVPAGMRHGDGPARRDYGCTCEVCRPPRRNYTPAKTRDDLWGLEPPGHLKHYPRSRAASMYGCRCALCIPSRRPPRRPNGEGLSATERDRKLVASKRGTPVPPDVKHGRYAWRVYGCRCTVCKNSKKAERSKKRWGWLETAHGRWHEPNRNKGKTTICWPPAGAGPDWVCPHELEEAA